MSRAVRTAVAAVVLVGVTCCAPAAPQDGASKGGDSAGGAQAGTAAVAGTPQVCWTASAPDRGSLRFADRTTELGAEAALRGMMGHAVAAGDVNDDGWVDLFVGSFADRPPAEYAVRGATGPAPDRLLLGSATGFRVDDRFPGEQARTAGAVFADLDKDGDLDLVLSRNPRPGERGSAPTVVLRNDAGRFTQAYVLDRERGGRSVGVLDLDGDGLLDLFLVDDKWSGGRSAFFRNAGDLRFTEATAAAGLPGDIHGLGVGTADLDGDGRADLFVAGSNRLFLNRDGRFHEEPGDVFAWEPHGKEDDPAGVAIGDLDGDGRPDLVIGQHYNSTLDFGQRVPVRVYRNLGPGAGRDVRFEDVTAAAGLTGLPTKAPHVEIVDLDADGRPDLLTTAATAGGGAPMTFRNVGSGPGQLRFEPVEPAGAEQYWVTGATIDADHDGAVDVMLVEWTPSRPMPVLRAAGDQGRWLAVQSGPAGSRGIGALVSVYAAGHLGEADHLVGSREITAATGFGAGAEPVARFGLGKAAAVDIEVRPANGAAAIRATNVATDSWVSIDGSCPQ